MFSKCRNCSNLMQYYKIQKHILEKINSALDVLHKNVDYIWVWVIGGEPLMNKDWAIAIL